MAIPKYKCKEIRDCSGYRRLFQDLILEIKARKSNNDAYLLSEARKIANEEICHVAGYHMDDVAPLATRILANAIREANQ